MTDFDDLDERDRALAQKLRVQLRASEDLDYVTKAKLSAARARAVAAFPASGRLVVRYGWPDCSRAAGRRNGCCAFRHLQHRQWPTRWN